MLEILKKNSYAYIYVTGIFERPRADTNPQSSAGPSNVPRPRGGL